MPNQSSKNKMSNSRQGTESYGILNKKNLITLQRNDKYYAIPRHKSF